ncbi:MAG: hypothetical protein IPL26_00595 [Leptospiraceae bacterium]|nr:hypothetical protein [Leptospiraceae bacterium]
MIKISPGVDCSSSLSIVIWDSVGILLSVSSMEGLVLTGMRIQNLLPFPID